VALLLLPCLSFAEPAVSLFPAVGSTHAILLSGRVLRDRVSTHGTPLSRNLRNLLAAEWRGAPVELRALGQAVKLVSDGDGRFSTTLEAPRDAPFVPGLYPMTAQVPGARATAWVRIVSDGAPFVVVSDIDDTVAVTQVLERRKLLANALFRDGHSHKAVPGMSAWYRCLLADKVHQPGLAFVSGTPIQYMGRVSTFLRVNEFPPAALYLRTLSLKTLGGGYKEPALTRLLDALSHPVLLIGDSGEHDPEIYAELRKTSPSRVRRIYIRDAGRTAERSRFEGMVVFKDAKDAAKDSLEQGFISRECFEKEFGTEKGP
jgi:phosphatidate phosphatase APP1